MMLDYEASSLYSVIADGKYKKTSFSRGLIISLITGSHLQANCNKQGFNINLKSPTKEYMQLRFGLVANNENGCSTCDSWIGFGAKYHGCDKYATNMQQWLVVTVLCVLQGGPPRV